eukprot:gene39688-52354_t
MSTWAAVIISPIVANADMLTFPLPSPLKNNIVLVRSGESFAEQRHELETNPVKKLSQKNALTNEGREQAINAAKSIQSMGFSPTFIWTSNTERAYETAAVMAAELQLGQNRIVPEYSFLDARAVGLYEGQSDSSWDIIHKADTEEGSKYRPPANTDGTPSDSVSDVLVRVNQLISTIESMYSGENVVIISPDSEVLSIISAAIHDENPDESLLTHYKYSFKNGEVRPFDPLIKPRELLATGQTRAEADDNYRQMQYMRAISGRNYAMKEEPASWMDIWHLSVDSANNK